MDWVNFLDNGAGLYDEKRLTVFVGEKSSNGTYSAMCSTGGMIVPQFFTWENFPDQDINRYYIDPEATTVTLSVTLEPTVGTTVSSIGATFDGTLPTNTMAVNLSSKFGENAVDNMMNEDVWGKLVYYDPGRLGRGWCFNPLAYLPPSQSQETRGFNLIGGAIPDYTDTDIALAVTNTAGVKNTPSANFQLGRNLALLSQMTDQEEVGMSSYWSIGVEPVPKTAVGNIGGKIIQGTDTTTDPDCYPWGHFGTPSLGYPSYLDPNTDSGSSVYSYWQAVNPIYGRPATEGFVRMGNTLSITPSVYFTNFGKGLLTDGGSDPGGQSGAAEKKWTTYFSESTSDIVLSETMPLNIECPLMKVKPSLLDIPYVEAGLRMLVPVTRITNGILFYTPVMTNQVIGKNMVEEEVGYSSTPVAGGAKGYYPVAAGLIYTMFNVKEVKLTINLSCAFINNAKDAERFFATAVELSSFTMESKLWLRWFLNNPQEQISSTVSLLQLNGQQVDADDYLEFKLTARDIIDKIGEAMAIHNLSSSAFYNFSQLYIQDVIVSCTLKPDLLQFYKRLVKSTQYQNTVSGTLMCAGAARCLSRVGPNLSAGAPSHMQVHLWDVGNGVGEYDNQLKISHLQYDWVPTSGTTKRNRDNDYYSWIPVYCNSLRMPDFNNSLDTGGFLTVQFNTNAILNFPWSGPQSTNQRGGGPGFDVDTNVDKSALAGYSNGWFNRYNPFSRDFDTNNLTPGQDKWEDLDSRLIDFNARSVEIWVSVSFPYPIYTESFTQNTTQDKGTILSRISSNMVETMATRSRGSPSVQTLNLK